MGSSPAWDRFVASLDVQGLESLRSLDLEALRELSDTEKEQARRLIVPRIAQGDPRVIDALVEIGTPAALADVERASKQGIGEAQVRAADYLWRVHRNPRVIATLRQLALSSPSSRSLNQEIVRVLSQVDHADADQALLDILASAPDEVAIAAVDALFVRFKLDEWEHVAGGKVQTLRWGLVSKFPTVRAHAIDELRSMIAARRSGADDRQLGIEPVEREPSAALERVKQAAQDPSSAVPLDAIDALKNGERDHAVDLWIARLEENDRRAVEALNRLATPRAHFAVNDFQSGRLLT